MKKDKQPKLTAMMIATALDSETARTSFGKLPLARERSAPIFSFGSGTRNQLEKVFLSKEQVSSIGTSAPGPKYVVEDNTNFKSMPSFSIGKDPRITLGRQVAYDHYSIVDVFTEPVKSKQFTQKHYGNTKFGTQSRMPAPETDGTPGPQYNPPLKPEVPTVPSYTLGARRNTGGSAIQNQVSTPTLVGPGRYIPEAVTAAHKSASQWTIGKGDKIAKDPRVISRNQTYDTKSIACGNQISSKKKNSACIKFKTATREQVSKLGMFRDMMSTQKTTVRIPHPKF